MRVVVRGGGDLASGTVYKLFQCGFEVVILECEKPTSIRRYVSFSEAVYHGSSKVEGVICKKANSLDEAETILSPLAIPAFRPFAAIRLFRCSSPARIAAAVGWPRRDLRSSLVASAAA